MLDVLRLEIDSTDIQHLTLVGTIPGVVPLLAAARNGPGGGRLQSEDDGTWLSWRAPGSETFGPPVHCSPDGTYLLRDGDDWDKWIRVAVYAAHLEPTATAEVFLDDRYTNGVAGADVTAEEAAAGDVSTRTITVRNVSTSSVSNVRVWTDSTHDGRTEVSLDGVDWFAPTTELAAVRISELAPGATATLYLRRTVAVGQASAAKELVHLYFSFDSFL